MNTLIRLVVRLVCWTVFDIIMILFNIGLVFANYMACKTAFDFLGYEQRPLSTDELLGPYLGAFFGKATMAHFYAGVIAGVIALDLVLVFYLMFYIADLVEARNAYQAMDDPQSAHIAKRRIVHTLILISLFLMALGYALYWDINLFRYRSMVSAFGIEDPQEAPKMLDGWPQQMQAYGTMFAWQAARIGSWGYIAVTVLSCLGLEFVFIKTRECGSGLLDALLESGNPPENTEEPPPFYGYDQNGQPVGDPNTPIAYDTEGNPVAAQDGETVTETAGQEPVEHQLEPVLQEAGLAAEPVYNAGQNGALGRSLFEPVSEDKNGIHPIPSTNGATQESTPRREPGRVVPGRAGVAHGSDAALREVVGGAEGERVSLAAALANPDQYWVDPTTHAVWNADLRRALVSNAQNQDQA